LKSIASRPAGEELERGSSFEPFDSDGIELAACFL
jgi:hypothetical protein